MRKDLRFYLLTLCFCFAASFVHTLSAQSFVKGGNEQFEWRLCGRAFFDGGFFFNDTTSLGNSFQVNDLRLGTRIRFLGNWEAKAELGFVKGDVKFKDIFIAYHMDRHTFKAGYQFQPFGNARVGSSNLRFMKNATADKVLSDKRRLGFTYSYNSDAFHFMGGVFSEGDIEKEKTTEEGYSFAAKFIGRPLMDSDRLIHIGFAPRFSSSNDAVRFSGGMPTDLLDAGDNTYLNAKVGQVVNQWKFDFELIMLCRKWYFQGQYYEVRVNRQSAVDNYRAGGWYAQLGYLICGDRHNYKAGSGMVVNPAPKSLEVLFRYDAVDLNDTDIRGGYLTDLTLGVNYFINKYIAAKLNYTQMLVADSSPMGGKDFGLLQARLQFSF